MAPLRMCGPGTSTMQGQNATSAVAFDSWKRLAAAATTPAINAAQSGWISGLLLKPASQRRTSAPMAGARRDQQQARRIERAENDAKRSRANGCEQREPWRGSWRQPASLLKRGLRSLGRQFAVADLIDHRRDGQYPAHVDAERLGGNDLREWARPRIRR